jgi:hypothetical protein
MLQLFFAKVFQRCHGAEFGEHVRSRGQASGSLQKSSATPQFPGRVDIRLAPLKRGESSGSAAALPSEIARTVRG